MPKYLKGFTALFAILSLAGCTQKVGIAKERTAYLANGSYRSSFISDAGTTTRVELQLNRNGQFSFATLEGSCRLEEKRGTWKTSQDLLTLEVKEARNRKDCASAWVAQSGTASFQCPLRSVTTTSFQLLHDEIRQGTAWTVWERKTDAASFADQDSKPATAQPGKVTLNSAP